MVETAYEFECNRAELLGLDKPDFQEFCKEYDAKKAAEEIALETEHLKEIESENEALKGVSGGLEELSSILRSTQKRITNFKVSYGSITDYLKDKIGRRGSGASTKSANSESTDDPQMISQHPNDSSNEHLHTQEIKLVNDKGTTQFENKGFENDKEEVVASHLDTDLSRALDNHVDKLDSLVTKAENCEIGLRHQNKQMKGFLGK
ncbi:uncharacterized protein LOC108733915 [Agrilus planipennis]|uniref:Uncharacterized protein LOC108733915 n=1 Tax=Agrilus planipennis TaxID=224129 RepID=A0A7F5RIH1_AGRPL|nr:uncharacterized protein LOC108733915 [Agrilus planipennis]XP_025835660.1 uncharacterized protein LOC108733915 [Agrilus planipennis]XP_025835661.1 uncharacterized protein LOC108733915 [Agrilus planipennis]